MGTELLKVDRLNAFYGDSHVLHDVSFTVRAGQLLTLLGRNGAGKSTCVNSIIGFLPPRGGSIELQGQALHSAPPEQISKAGVGLVPQGRRIFPSLTVRENLDVAAHRHSSGDRRTWTRNDINNMFPRLQERQSQLAGSLSGGEQQMLAIGRALMTNPKLLMLDEPSEGLAPQIVRELGNVFASLKKEISIVLVEQNLGLAMKVADDVVLLNTGRVVFTGSRDDFERQADALQSHLGVH